MTAPITPVAYRLRIEPDLVRFQFAGRMTLSATAGAPVDRLTLDCAELAIWQCRLRRDASEDPMSDCPFSVDPAAQRLSVHPPEPLAGSFQLTVDYVGKINDRMAGFYRSRYTSDRGPAHIAVTQFQESDARRAFPCLDHPARKAVFQVEMVVDADLTAISNTAIETVSQLEDGRRLVTFEATPKMSTYLLFFGVGPFEIHVDPVDPRVRAVCLPGAGDQTGFGREFGRKALAYGETYYAIDYPLSKMDLIAVPDFAFGAMENWGAITFRENLLLNIPGVTSREAQARICEVIAHEITHQWFGNLVTPEQWKYLWLNESFATYFGYGMVDHHYPDWEVWHQFVRNQTETALNRDALRAPFAIEMPGGAPVAINTSTAPIIYSKGGSVLRQLEAWIGPDHFQSGLRRYLTDFAYGCAASHHLWESMTAASGMPVDDLMRSWVTQPGFPVITVRRHANRLVLTQRRFTYLPMDAEQHWMVPATVSTYAPEGGLETQTVLLDGPRVDVSLPPGTAAYKINPQQSGFFHVCYDDADNLSRLGEMAGRRELSPLDRWGLQNDLFALVKAGQSTMATFLEMAGNYKNERAYLPLASLDSHLFEAFMVLRGPIRERIAATSADLVDAALDAIGRLPAADEPQTTAMLRDQLLVHAALIGKQDILDFLRDGFDRLAQGIAVPPDIFKSVAVAGAVSGGQTALSTIVNRFESSQAEHERMTLAGALGCFRDWQVLEKALAYTLDNLPDRIRFIPLTAAAGNPAASDHLWAWFEANIARISQMHPLLFERVVATAVPGPGLKDPERTGRFCQNLRRQQPRLEDVMALSLERLEINIHFRSREQ
jgi:tricorn protease interacting factor F2/3